MRRLPWDVNGATAGTGGTGTWNTTSVIWFNGSTFQAWNNATFDNGVFGGTVGTVTVGTPINVHNLTFSVTGVVVIQPTVFAGQSARVGGSPLPVDAAPVQEMHGDWRVDCAQQDGKRVCVFSQQQTNKEPVGCLVGVSLDAGMIASLRKAQSLIVRATADGGQGAVFAISLKGFANALDRAAALAP